MSERIAGRRTALLSVSDKRGLAEFARGLVDLGFDLVSSGGTARSLAQAGLAVRTVESLTGFPEMLDGRVKTLHPHVHGGILARRERPEHLAQLAEHGIQPIDLVAVNLYPFEETARSAAPLDEVIEQIDIGGPALLRSAAKNHEAVVVVVSPGQYEPVLAALRAGGPSRAQRRRLALAAFRHTAFYDALIAGYFARLDGVEEDAWAGQAWPDELVLAWRRRAVLRYGENPHQAGALYVQPLPQCQGVGALAFAEQLQGKELSYNNLADAQAAWQLVNEFARPAAVAVKHMNPCGVAVAGSLLEAYEKAYAADPLSIFGGIVALNGTVERELAQRLASIFLEVVIAPDFTPEARAELARKGNLRVLRLERGAAIWPAWSFRAIGGGLLVQEEDAQAAGGDDPASWRTVTRRAPEPGEREELAFAWRVVKHVKSNAIVVSRDGQTLGVGAGQMNRIDAARIALRQAGEQARGACLASDAFFPFPDVVQEAAASGVRAIVQPGGSVRDAESIAAADEAGIAMLFTGVRHFRH